MNRKQAETILHYIKTLEGISVIGSDGTTKNNAKRTPEIEKALISLAKRAKNWEAEI